MRCTSTPHTTRRRTARAHIARAHTAGAHNASMGNASATTRAWETQARRNEGMHSKHIHSGYTQREHGRRKRNNASMHSASTKHGPVHPRNVDDLDERSVHDLDECCTTRPVRRRAARECTARARTTPSTHSKGTRSRHTQCERAAVGRRHIGPGYNLCQPPLARCRRGPARPDTRSLFCESHKRSSGTEPRKQGARIGMSRAPRKGSGTLTSLCRTAWRVP